MTHRSPFSRAGRLLASTLLVGSALAADPKVSRSPGDLGPPQGPVVRAALSSPPHVPPATGRTAPTKVTGALDFAHAQKPADSIP